MQFDDRMMTEIREANLSYLILAQRLIRADKAQALYRLRFGDAMLWSLLTEHGRTADGDAERSAGRLHASILMAGNFDEAIGS